MSCGFIGDLLSSYLCSYGAYLLPSTRCLLLALRCESYRRCLPPPLPLPTRRGGRGARPRRSELPPTMASEWFSLSCLCLPSYAPLRFSGGGEHLRTFRSSGGQLPPRARFGALGPSKFLSVDRSMSAHRITRQRNATEPSRERIIRMGLWRTQRARGGGGALAPQPRATQISEFVGRHFPSVSRSRFLSPTEILLFAECLQAHRKRCKTPKKHLVPMKQRRTTTSPCGVMVTKNECQNVVAAAATEVNAQPLGRKLMGKLKHSRACHNCLACPR